MNKFYSLIINKLKRDKKLVAVIALGFFGIFLIFCSTFPESNKNEKKEDYSADYLEQQIEKDLCELIKTVNGAGKVKVMITIECLQEQVFAQENEKESDENSLSSKSEYVIVEKNNIKEGLVIKTISPVIRGVGICCEGADSFVVKNEITQLVCASLGISKNKIYVTKMQN